MGMITIKTQSAASVPLPATDQLRLFVDSSDSILKTKDSFGVVRPSGVGTADELATTGAPVDVSASIPPTVGQVLMASSATTAVWTTITTGPAQQLDTTGAAVTISGAAPPTTGQVLRATSATTANWQTLSTGLVQTAWQTGSISAAVDQLVVVDVTAGPATVTLPTAPAANSQIGVKIATGATNPCTIAAGGADAIDFSATLVLNTNFEWAILIYDTVNANWMQIG